MADEKFTSNIFSVESKDAEDKKVGFRKAKVITTDILDNFDASDTNAVNKMCTSIPTPFARLFLFNTAFKELNEKEKKLRQINQQTDEKYFIGKSVYHFLVDDCLDMLEFIFYHGADEKFNVIEWDREKELKLLDSSNTIQHTRLCSALNDHLTDSTLNSTKKIYLFTWNDHPDDPDSRPVVVGGTSPFSLVFTSPNWIREKNFNEWMFTAGRQGRLLFEKGEESRPLYTRSDKFKEYIYKLWKAYDKGGESSLNEFWEYISLNWKFYEKPNRFIEPGRRSLVDLEGTLESYDESQFISEEKGYVEKPHYIKFDENGNYNPDNTKEVAISANLNNGEQTIYLRCNRPDDIVIHEDYMIDCAKLPEETMSGTNAQEQIAPPLILDEESEIAGAKYVEGESWGSYKTHLKSYNSEPTNYWERKIPGFNKTYPYLRKEDLLEDKIIFIAGNLSNKHFLAGTNGNVTYLPPIKKTFFKFFNLTDFYDKLSLQEGTPRTNKELYSITQNKNGSVTATLNIPVKRGTVELKRTYFEKDIVYMDDASSNIFNMSIFPFYKLIDDDAAYNKYSVMLGCKGNVELHFYNLDNINSEINVKTKERSINESICTKYYTVNESFDLIEVETNGAKGAVLPLFLYKRLGTNNMVYCVDFGTTNTHIAYAIDKGSTVEEPSDFEYSSEIEAQVVSLFDSKSYITYLPNMKREFVPEDILLDTGNKTISNTQLSFPIRTAVCVANRWMADTNTVDCNLFGDANVGFYFLNEETDPKKIGNKYEKNIKWKSDGKSIKLRETFFNEVMWLLKNKAVFSDCGINFNFYFTFPQSMDDNSQRTLYDAWNNARINVKACSCKNVGELKQTKYNQQLNDQLHPDESIVPWYYLRKLGWVKPREKFMNIDIGGGTMDIVYFDPTDNESYTYSARFAADDLWGDGLDEQSANKKNNAFIRDYCDNYLPTLAQQLKDRFTRFKDTAEDSSDVISFLFKYDNDYHFSDYLSTSKLISLPLIHLVAVSYFVGLILKKEGFGVPDKMSFTGMGSLYLKIISQQDNKIAEIIKSVLQYQGIPANKAAALNVKMIDRPKVVTARGGVVFHHPNEQLRQSERIVWGYDGESEFDNLQQCDVSGKTNDVLKLVENCIDYFNSNFFKDTKDTLHCGWNYKPIDKAKIMKLADDSFKSWHIIASKNSSEGKQKDPLFFWAFKDMLFNYGFEI